MSSPTWNEYMVPVLQVLADGEVHRARQISDKAADALGVTADERLELIPSGQARYVNRALWALSYLSRARAVERPSRGHYRITPTGRALLASHPEGLIERDLRDLEGYVSTRTRTANSTTPPRCLGHTAAPAIVAEDSALSPLEQVEEGIGRIHSAVAAELLLRLHANEPAFFEQAVLDLLMGMGYGGAEGQATRTQLSNDGGIDGVIDQDALGLSRVYVQAKRYATEASVGRPEVQGFVGALQGNQASQGVFITTGRFSSGAVQYANAVSTRVVLIDGERLALLMIRYGVGVQVKRTLQIVEIDEDFFE